MDSRRSLRPTDLVFLLDVDNTLLDNDARHRRFAAAPGRHAGQDLPDRILADLRAIAARARLRRLPRRAAAIPREHPRDPDVLAVSLFLLGSRSPTGYILRALDVIAHLRQPRPSRSSRMATRYFSRYKVERSGSVGGGRRGRSSSTSTRSRCWTMSSAASGPALRDGGRQTPHPDRRQERLGRARDHGIREAGPLRDGPGDARFYPAADVTIERIATCSIERVLTTI